MEYFAAISILLADAFSGLVNVLSALETGLMNLSASGDGGALLYALALGAINTSDFSEETLAGIRRWRGTIAERFANIDNLVVTIQSHYWGTLPSVYTQIIANRTQLATLIPKCASSQGSGADRTLRNVLLKTTVGLCLGQMRAWAYTQYYNNVMTITDVHTLGFLLPGEAGGRRARSKANEVKAEVKVTILSEDVIRVVIDQAADENAAHVRHGWPPGVRIALIIILADDGGTEVYRQQTSRLYNEIQMPEGSRGKLFIIKASFLKHVDDIPVFGPQPTFSMPLTTEDLAAVLDRRIREERKADPLAAEQRRREAKDQQSTDPAQ